MRTAPGPLCPRSCGPPASMAAAVVTTDALLGFCNEDKVDELPGAAPKSCSKWLSIRRTVVLSHKRLGFCKVINSSCTR